MPAGPPPTMQQRVLMDCVMVISVYSLRMLAGFVIARSEATKQSSFLVAAKKAGLLSFARNDEEGNGVENASAPERLDLRHAAVAVGQLDRHRLRRRRELQIGRGVMRDGAGIAGIARRQLQHLVGHGAVDADADLA